jgi:hypothetical protein
LLFIPTTHFPSPNFFLLFIAVTFILFSALQTSPELYCIEAENLEPFLGAVQLCHVIRPSVCPHISAQLPQGGFLWNLMLATITQIQICLKSDKIIGQFTWKPQQDV